MQIFVTDYDPKIAAQNLCDTHLNRQIIESAQMLSTYIFGIETYKTWNKYRIQTNKELYKKETGLCLPCYINHPCNVWLREDIKNVHWLHNHFVELLLEYNHRTNKHHGCTKYAPVLAKHLMPLYSFHMPRPEKFCNCTNIQICTSDNKDNTIECYRRYYNEKQMTMKVPMIWTKREKPEWFKEIELLDISFCKGVK